MPRRQLRPTLRRVAAALAVAATVSACGGGALTGDAAAVDAAAVGRLQEADRTTVAAAVNSFGLELHRLVEPGPRGNSVTSPLSAALALAMLTAGAQGESGEQLVGALGLESTTDPRFAALLLALAEADGVELGIADALWVDDQAVLLDGYVEHVRGVFGATVDCLDLGDAAAADVIDTWVEEHTDDRIDTIAEGLGIPDRDAGLVLANAVWFLGEWTDAFDEDRTRDARFTLTDGEVAQLPTMHADRTLALGRLPDAALGRFPYGDDERFAMTVILPDEGVPLDDVLADLDASTWADVASQIAPVDDVQVKLPRFELAFEADLVAPLRSLGVTDVFDEALADLGALSPDGLVVTRALQKTWFRVDEQGTEAAAVTGVKAGFTSAPIPSPPAFVVDRPFAFAITDIETGVMLFLGTVHDPRG